MAAASGMLSAARNVMKVMTEGKGFDRLMRNVSDPETMEYPVAIVTIIFAIMYICSVFMMTSQHRSL